MHTQEHRQKLRQAVQSWVSSVVPVLYGNLLLRTSSLIVLATVATSVTSPALHLSAQAAMIEAWKIDPDTGKVEVLLPEGVTPRLSVLSQPARLVLDLPNTEVGINVTERYESGLVRQVSLTQSEPGVARITVDFVSGVVLDPQDTDLRPIGIENLWVLRPTIQAVPEPEPVVDSSQTIASPQTVDQVEPSPDGSAADLEGLEAETPSTTQFTPQTQPPVLQQSQTTPPVYNPNQPVLPNQQPQPVPSVEILTVPVDDPTQVGLITDPLLQPPPPPPSETPITQVQPTPEEPIEFGQPLPRSSDSTRTAASLGTIDRRPPNILLTSGTRVQLQYPTPGQVRLRSKPERQDVLLLQGGIVDRDGNYLVPPDTPVVGRFETSRRGSRFIAEAINLEGRSIPFKAKSDWIDGSLEANPKNILLDSGIGGLGIFLLSGFSGIGLLAGAVGGAAFGFASSPQPTTLQPQQVIEVQLTQDLRQSEFLVQEEE